MSVKLTSPPAAHRRLAGASALLIAGAVALTACGSNASTSTPPAGSSPTGSTSGSTAGSSSVSAAVTDAVTKAMAPVTTFPGPTATVQAPAGKTVMILECGSAGTGCVLGANGAKAAAAKLGWKATITDGKLDPTVWNQLIQQAVADKVDGIVMTSVNPSLVKNGLAQAKAAGIPVVDIYQPKFAGAPELDGYVTSDHAEGGKLAADWMIQDSGGKANVLVLDDPEYPETVQRNDALAAELKAECSGCSVTRQTFSAGSMAQSLAPQVSASLGQHGDVGYVWAPFDAASPFVQQGIQQAGKTKSVKLVSAEGDPSAVNRLKAGTQAADLVTADDYMGWVSIDDLVRIFAGAQHDQVNIVPQRLLTSSNISSIPSGGTWSLDGVDYAAKFAELWGK